ncbi:MAG TPA: hypothetical protein VMU69_12750 [Bradyrhizobium sp.]|nr:hypothetical protein [Bradyrhizobium sp.]
MNQSELRARIAERIARAKSQLAHLDRSDAANGATTSAVSSEPALSLAKEKDAPDCTSDTEALSLAKECTSSDSALSLANGRAKELTLAKERTSSPSPPPSAGHAPAARSERVASLEARQPKSLGSTSTEEIGRSAPRDDTGGRASGAPRHGDGDVASARHDGVVASARRSEIGGHDGHGGKRRTEPEDAAPGSLLKESTYAKFQLWDNGFQEKKSGRTRYRVYVYLWTATRPEEINPYSPECWLVFSLPATTKKTKETIKKLPEDQRDFAEWGLFHLESMEVRRGDLPHPLMGWPQLPNTIGQGTKRDYDYLLFVDWIKEGDDILPRFLVVHKDDRDGMVLGMVGMVAETNGNPGAPGWLGYHDTIGYNDYRKTRKGNND